MISRHFPVMNIVNGWLGSLFPFVFRLMMWGALASILSIMIYARLSPQTSIKRLKEKIRGLQREMLGLDLDFLHLSKENLKTSLRLFAAVLGPGLVSVLPVLILTVVPGCPWNKAVQRSSLEICHIIRGCLEYFSLPCSVRNHQHQRTLIVIIMLHFCRELKKVTYAKKSKGFTS